MGRFGARRRGARVAVAALGLAGVAAAGAPAASHADPAPGAPGETARWTTGAKQGVGTSAGTGSKVWYSLSEGVLAEVYYPRVDVADTRALELVVTDGRTFTDRETEDMTHRVEVSGDALTQRQVNTDEQRRYRITKTFITDPDRATVLVRVKFESLDGGDYDVFAHLDPALANSGRHDDARTDRGALVAVDTAGDTDVASALVADRPFLATANGYAGTESDGLSDLREDHDLDADYDSAPDGNVVQTARLALGGERRTSQLTLALGFATTPATARMTARASVTRPFGRTFAEYVSGWSRYLGTLDAAPRSVAADARLRKQYRIAAMTLRAHEDKTFRGANIASLTVPWGQAIDANEEGVGGYHLVWSRDLYQVATAQLAAGDRAAAERSLDYLFDVQQKPDGSFPQNTLLDGTPYWTSLQLDEVAFPIVLAWQLERDDAATYRDHVKPAADFIVSRGPATPQERWEEEGGYSPSTIASQIAGLTAAADLARRAGDATSAALYQGVADEWERRVDGWTFTTTGPLGDGRYFERIDDDGDPNDGSPLDINNGGGVWDERSVVDAGFLELVRLGIRPADDPNVVASLPEVDETIRVATPNGAMWYRYNHDGYGEKADGSPYDGTGVGRLWPLLSGERGEYELAAGRPASEHLRTMARAANEGYMIPEQVWDRREPTAGGFAFGEGTGSATPLAWSMAQFMRLALSIDAGRPVETPSVVAERYVRGERPASPALEVTSPAAGTTTGEASVAVTGTTDAERVYVNAGGRTVAVAVTGGAFTAEAALTLGTNAITVVAVGADGGTATRQITVTSTNFGTPVGAIDDPAGDDHGPGTYVYPTNSAFVPGAFDLTRFAVHEAGDTVNLVATIAGEVANPWGGNQISVQRLNVYVRTGTGSGAVPALPGTNAQLAAPYDRVINAAGFDELAVRDASGAIVADARLLALPATRQIVVSVPRAALGGADLAGARFAVALGSHSGGDEGVGGFRPVYDRDFWESTAGTGLSFVREYRFGGGAGEFAGDTAAKDTDTRDPNLLDVVVGPGQTQGAVLDWRAGAPVTLPYVALTRP